jgi:exopolysaccharide biosynthesis predicted pyruvyltransferase EpsI
VPEAVESRWVRGFAGTAGDREAEGKMDGHNFSMFSGVREHLETFRGEKFVYVPNPGNAGDSLIAHATYQFFDAMGLDYEVGDECGIYPDRAVIYGGGGNLVQPLINLRNFLINNADKCTRLTVLPQGFRDYGDEIAALGAHCTLFCRDRVAFDFARRHARKAQVLLAHDMALATDVGRTMADGGRFPLPLLSNPTFARRNVRRLLRTTRARTFPSRTLNCFRGGLEKTDIAIPRDNVDVSAIYATGRMSKDFALESTYRMMQFMDRYSVVQTNKLHVAIIGILLNKRVNIFDNSYGKNRSVFEQSIDGRFPNVEWRG